MANRHACRTRAAAREHGTPVAPLRVGGSSVLTLDDLDELERCAEPIRASPSGGAQQVTRTATFEQAAAPYRGLVRSARRLLLRGQRIGAELERELRHGARALSLARRRLSQLTSRS